jgi:sarcosine oxidase subunit alpha
MNDSSIVPPEASQIVRPGTNEILGRITSSRYSPTIEKSIGLAQVPPTLAAAGIHLTIVLADGSRTTARVMEHYAHFDPEGVRLRA